MHAVDLLGTGLSGALWLQSGWGFRAVGRAAAVEQPEQVGTSQLHACRCLAAGTCGALQRRALFQSTYKPARLRPAPCRPLPPCAGRPPFRARNTVEAESFFVESLEAWRREQGLEKMVLMGHSMGGYLSGVQGRWGTACVASWLKLVEAGPVKEKGAAWMEAC